MFEHALSYLGTGMKIMRQNTRLLLIGVLIFVFPLFFLWVNQQFFTAAHQNITTSEKQRIQTIHDLLVITLPILQTDPEAVERAFEAVASDNPDITALQLIRTASSGELIVSAALDPTARETVITANPFTELPLAAGESSFIVPLWIDQTRVWQVYRALPEQDWYLYSEHDFTRVDSVIAVRQQQSYIALTLIFTFLIALAYWVYRQDDWAARSRAMHARLNERDQLANLIAHELRSPLTAVSGYASFLAEADSLSRDEQEYISIIRRSTDRLVRLVNDFLEVSRIQAGKLSLTWRSIKLTELLDEVVASQRGVAEEKGVRLEREPLLRTSEIKSDPDRLTQILTNLVSNAVKYTDAGGSVTISTHLTRHSVTIRIMDTGHGMSAAEQAQLFTPFTRFGSQSVQAEVTGTGLGMWITKQLVEQLDGTIEVESIRGQGTHISITLPLEPTE